MTALIIICIVFGLLFFSVFGNIIKISRKTDDLYTKLEQQEHERIALNEKVDKLAAQLQDLKAQPVPAIPPENVERTEGKTEDFTKSEHFKEGTAYPYIIDNYGKLSQREMAKNLGVSRSNIRNWIKKLQKAGRIQQSTNENEGSEV